MESNPEDDLLVVTTQVANAKSPDCMFNNALNKQKSQELAVTD